MEMRPMDRTRAEFAAGIVVGLVAMVVPMTWWLRGALLLLTTGLAADLAWRSPLTTKYHWAARLTLTGVVAVTILLLSWPPLYEQYKTEGGFASISANALYFFASEYFRLLLAIILGALIGNQFSPFRPSVPRLTRQLGTPTGPNVQAWFSVSDSLDQFVDKAILSPALSLLTEYQTLKVQLDEADAAAEAKRSLQTIETQISFIGRTDEFAELRTKTHAAERAYLSARQAVFDNLIHQPRFNHLIARGLPFNDKTLEGDWEIIKAAYWAVLTFHSSDVDTVSGGGRTYKGVQIGKIGDAK